MTYNKSKTTIALLTQNGNVQTQSVKPMEEHNKRQSTINLALLSAKKQIVPCVWMFTNIEGNKRQIPSFHL